MTNQPSPNVQDYRKEDFYWNDEDGIIPQFQSKPIDLDPDMAGKITITAAPIKMDGVDMKTTRFVRTDGKTGRRIKLRMQDMDIEADLNDNEVSSWVSYLQAARALARNDKPMTNLPSNKEPPAREIAGKITITAAPIKMDGVDMKTTRFVRTDGKTGHEIKLRMQDMDIEVELTAEEIRLWANYLYEYLWDKVLRASWINKPDGWLD